MSLQAYQKTQRQSESPRDAEYRLFGQVTHALIEADKGRSDFEEADRRARLESASVVDARGRLLDLGQPIAAERTCTDHFAVALGVALLERSGEVPRFARAAHRRQPRHHAGPRLAAGRLKSPRQKLLRHRQKMPGRMRDLSLLLIGSSAETSQIYLGMAVAMVVARLIASLRAKRLQPP